MPKLLPAPLGRAVSVPDVPVTVAFQLFCRLWPPFSRIVTVHALLPLTENDTLNRSLHSCPRATETVQLPPPPPPPPPEGATARPVLAEMCPGHRLRACRSCRMPGSAWMVFGGQSCMRMIWPLVRRPAACRIWATLALFQSCESTSQMISRSPNDDSTDRNVALVSPYGGRKRFGVTPAVCWIACWVCEISDCIWDWLNVVMCGWSQLWLPICRPAFLYACISDGLAWACWPVGN